MTGKEDDLDEAFEALWEQLARPHPRDPLRREQDDIFKYGCRDTALETWGPLIEAEIEAELARKRASLFLLHPIAPRNREAPCSALAFRESSHNSLRGPPRNHPPRGR